MVALVSEKDGVICCPEQACGRAYKADKINSLRRHCKREHNQSISIKSTRLSAEESRSRQRVYSARYRAKQQSAKLQIHHYPREPLTEDDADADGVYGSASCPVQYRQSTISGAGNGVFAAVDLYPGDIVTWYAGAFTTCEPADKAYAIGVSGGFIDGLRVPHRGEGLGSFVNRESRGISRTRKNCELVGGWSAKHKIYVEVTSKIKAGKELFTTYSRGYRFS